MTTLKNIISSSVFIAIFALHPSLNKGDNPITSFQHLVYGNSLKISTNKLIDKNLIRVKWVCKTPNDSCKNLLIFEHGEQVNQIPSEKGNQILLVSYNDKVIGELPQKKLTKNQSHQYKIELLGNENSLFFKGNIEGPTPYSGAPVTIATL